MRLRLMRFSIVFGAGRRHYRPAMDVRRMNDMAIAFLLAALAVPAHPEEPAAALGKQRAAGSRLEWGIREGSHPSLGNIRFAYIKRPVETPAGNATVFSRAYFSCQKDRRMFAIELANAAAPADPDALRPASEPRLVCNRPAGPDDAGLLQEDLLATWEISDRIGDMLTRGLRAFPLRECVSIGVVQEVILPPEWGPKTARVEFEILPYDRELDSIFVACGERSAYAPAPVAPAAAAAPAKPNPQASESPWQAARVVASGKTNVRARPTLQSAIVVELHPGDVVLVQRTQTEWWRAKVRKGAIEGYIRQDRLVFKSGVADRRR
jgi:hypothetical protein